MAKLFKMLRKEGRGRIYPYTKELMARQDMVPVFMNADQIKAYNGHLTPADQAPLPQTEEAVYDDGIAVKEAEEPTVEGGSLGAEIPPPAPVPVAEKPTPAAPAPKPVPVKPKAKAKKPVVAKPEVAPAPAAGPFDK